MVLAFVSVSAYAHEGHAPLPTKGVEVNVEKGTILLTKESRDALGLQTAEVTTTVDEQRLLAYARLVAPWDQNAVVAAQIPGRIVAIDVQPGEWVEAGQALAEIESFELETLQFDLVKARLAVELSEKLLAHYQELAGESVEAGQLQQATATHVENLNALSVAKLKLLNLGFTDQQLHMLEDRTQSQARPTMKLISPIRGRIHHNDLTIGKVLVPGEHLFEVNDLSTIWCRIEMLEHDFHRVQIGQEVDIRVNSLPDRELRGRVEMIEPSLDPSTFLGTAWVDLKNDDPQSPELLPGMFGQAQVVAVKPETLLSVPATAVARDGAERFVLVQQESTARASQFIKRNIVVVRQTNDTVQFRSSDIFPGDTVVTTGAYQLFNFFVQSVLLISPEARQNINLRVETSQMRSIETVFSSAGIVELPPEKRDSVSVQLNGVLERICVLRGQSVKAGDVLAELTSLEFQDLQLQLINTHVSMNNLRTTWDRLQQLTPLNIRSRRQIWEIENQMNLFQNQFDSVKRKLHAVGISEQQIEAILTSRQLVSRLSVRATIDGRVSGLQRRLGQTIAAGESIFEIHHPEGAWIRGFVNESDLPRTKIGQSTRVRLVSQPDVVLSARLVRQSQTVNPENRMLSVWLELSESPQQPLAHNMLSRIDFIVDSGPPVLTVPREAIVADGTRYYLFVQNANKQFERRFVELGQSDDRFVEVKSGVNGHEPVAVWGTADLQTAYAALR